MINQSETIVESVEKTISTISEENFIIEFSPDVLEAMRLAELYNTIKPEEYILPLNALAGFSMSYKSKQ